MIIQSRFTTQTPTYTRPKKAEKQETEVGETYTPTADRSSRPSRGILSRWGHQTATRALALVGIGVFALAMAGCTDKSAPTTPGAPPAVTATTLTERLQDLKGKDGYAAMTEAGYYHQVLGAIAKDASAKTAEADNGKIADTAAKAFDIKGDPKTVDQTETDALKAIGAKSAYHETAQAALAIGQKLAQDAPNAPSGFQAQIKGALYDQGMNKVLEELPGLAGTVQAKTGVGQATIKDYTDMLTLEAKAAQDYSKEVNDPGLTVSLYEGTANLLYTQVQSNGQLLNTQFGAALTLLKGLSK